MYTESADTGGQPPNSSITPPSIASMLRVNQAGEYGARRIYKGQLAALGASPVAPIIQHMADQEEAHLAAFNQLCLHRRVRPTALSPMWHFFGYALGFVSGKMGPSAAMACTVAVEEVIDAHYQEQLQDLERFHPHGEDDLKETIRTCREDELLHRDTGLDHGATSMPAYGAFTMIVKLATRLAIEASKRL